MPTARNVEKAIKELKRLYQLGLASLEESPDRMPYGRVQAAARGAQRSPEYFGKARKFASREGYTPADLEKLFALMRNHESPIGVGSVFKLLSIPKDKRDAIQTEAFRQGWSVRQLGDQLAARLGNRRKLAGRKPRIPESSKGAELSLLQATHRWERVYLMLHPP